MACGYQHTITLSDDGIAHSFGSNEYGALGLGNHNDVLVPTPIPNLPKIKLITCGHGFTVCVDHEGFIWSFGSNYFGQLGTGNKTDCNVPQKILNVPPVLSVACGNNHTLIITNDDNLWSWGCNKYGQLCLEALSDTCLHDKIGNMCIRGTLKSKKPHKTSFSNISNISAGYNYSLFQNNNGEIFSCGNNQYGQCGLGHVKHSQVSKGGIFVCRYIEGGCGLGHYNDPQITPSLITNVPPNIVKFVCGYEHSLFLDSEGNVFSVGNNNFGQLGLGHNTDQNELNKIPNIPPIKKISCVGCSSYLIDFEGNLWSFGLNRYGQLGRGDRTNINIPKVINTLKDIQQISYGSNGYHFIAKNSQNQIFVTGNNYRGQLGTGYTKNTILIPKEIDSQYSTIWRDELHILRAKSARK